MPDNTFNIPNKYQYIILDLDDTLYDEKLYLYPAYKKIATSLSQKHSVNATDIEHYLISEFEKGNRKNLFNKLCKQFQIPDLEIDKMLTILRTIQLPKIELFDKMKGLLDKLIGEKRNLFVITNGNLEQQENKVNSINWEGRDKDIQFVFAANHKPKPDNGSYNYLASKSGIIANSAIYIGDTEVDAIFAKNCGIAFLNVAEILNHSA